MAAPRRRLVLVLLLAAVSLLAAVAVEALLRPCAFPPGDGDSAGAPSPIPDDGGCFVPPGICVPVSRAGLKVVDFVLGVLMGFACTRTYRRFAASDDDDEASGRAKKAGYVAVGGDDVEAGLAIGKN